VSLRDKKGIKSSEADELREINSSRQIPNKQYTPSSSRRYSRYVVPSLCVCDPIQIVSNFEVATVCFSTNGAWHFAVDGYGKDRTGRRTEIAGREKDRSVRSSWCPPSIAQRKTAEAETEFLRATEIHPTNIGARNALGRFYLDAGRLPAQKSNFSSLPESRRRPKPGPGFPNSTTAKTYPKAKHAWRQGLLFEAFNARARVSPGRIYMSKTDAQEEFQIVS
jgi:hypothetical protein